MQKIVISEQLNCQSKYRTIARFGLLPPSRCNAENGRYSNREVPVANRESNGDFHKPTFCTYTHLGSKCRTVPKFAGEWG